MCATTLAESGLIMIQIAGACMSKICLKLSVKVFQCDVIHMVLVTTPKVVSVLAFHTGPSAKHPKGMTFTIRDLQAAWNAGLARLSPFRGLCLDESSPPSKQKLNPKQKVKVSSHIVNNVWRVGMHMYGMYTRAAHGLECANLMWM